MKDIIETLAAGSGTRFYQLSAGNPVILPEVVEQMWARIITVELLDSPDYGSSVSVWFESGYQPLIEAVVTDFNRRYGLNLTRRKKRSDYPWESKFIFFYATNACGGVRPADS